MVQVLLHRLFICPEHHRPIVVLRDLKVERCLSLWVSEAEWAAIRAQVRGEGRSPLPGHDLLLNMLSAFEATVILIELREWDCALIQGEVTITCAEQTHQILCHAGDAILLALKLEAPIYVPRALLQSRGWMAEEAEGHHTPLPRGRACAGRYVM